MAVVPEPPWLNKTSGVSARNGTTTHTITLGFTPTSGNFLMFVVGGGVTHTNGSWTERAAPVANGELSVFTKTSAGTETTFTDTTNGSNYPVVWAAYEFLAGTTWTGSANSASGSGTFVQLTGLPGTEQVVFGAMGVSSNTFNASNITTATWSAPWVEDAEVNNPYVSPTDGYDITIAHQLNVTATSITPTASTSYVSPPVGGVTRQAVTWALDVALYIPPEGVDLLRVPASTIVIP